MIAEALKQRPCYPHFAFLAGRGQVQTADWGLVHRLMDLTRAPHFNLHLGPRVTDFPGLALDSTDPRDRDRLVAAMTRDVLFAQREFPPERIALENLMWDPRPPWQIPLWALQPEVIREVIERTGCRLLLDISHAGITARRLGMTAEEYVLSLPVERLCEMHLSGTRLCEDGLWRDHRPMTDDDWRLAEWALGRIARGEWPAPQHHRLRIRRHRARLRGAHRRAGAAHAGAASGAPAPGTAPVLTPPRAREYSAAARTAGRFVRPIGYGR